MSIFLKNKNLENEFNKEFTGELIYKDGQDDYYFEGIASSYGNVDSYGDIFLEGSLDESVGKTVAIMPNHSWDITRAIGMGKLEKEGKKILIKGNFIKDDELSEKIVKLKKAGVPIKLSIGGRIKESKPYKKDGITYRGISKAEIYEVSVVFRGANPKAQITKGENEEENMDEILKAIQELKNLFAKAGTETEKNEILKAIEKLTEMLKNVEGISEEDKSKLAKIENFEKTVKDLEETIDKLQKQINYGKVGENKEELKKIETDLNTYFKTGIMSEIIKKTLNTSDESGGALLPEERAKEIIKEAMEESPMYSKARRYTTAGNSLKIRVKVKGKNNAHNQAEGTAAGEESGSTYEFLELKVGKITDKQSITQEMIDDAEYNVYEEVIEDSRENIAEKVAIDIWNGDGGVKNNEFYGIYKDTNVTGKAFEAELTWQNLKTMIYSMPKKTRTKSEFLVSTEALDTMRGFVDGNGRPLYIEPLTAGEPGRFMGYYVTEDPYMDGLEAGKFPVFFGVPKKFYAILMKKDMYVERKRDADEDEWVVYTRTRQGGKVRQASQGKLLKYKLTTAVTK